MSDSGSDNVHLFPHERGDGDTGKTPEESLFDALGPEFDDEDNPGDDEPAPREIDEEDDGDADSEDEDASDSEDNGSDDDEDEADDSDGEEPEDTYHVKVDGEEVSVTLEELKKGYSFTAHNTRTAQALANERKEFERVQSETSSLRDTYASRLREVEQLLEGAASGTEPDWDKLRQENPAEFAAQYVQFQREKERLGNLQRRVVEERKQLEQQAEAAQAQARQQLLLQEQAKLLEAVPEWADEKTAQTEKSALVDHAKSMGFTEDQIAQVMDHRVLLLLRDAKRYHDLIAKNGETRKTVEKKVKKAKVLPPGTKRSRPNSSQKQLREARGRLAESGSVRDAAAALYHILDDE